MSAIERESILPTSSLVAPSVFMIASSHGQFYVPAHIMRIEQFILAAIAKGDQMLTIEAPVRCGKSVYVDWHLPAWFLGTFPGKHVGIASHEQSFATSWGAKARDTLVEYGSSFGVSVTRDTRSRSWWEIERYKGSMRSFGIKGGGITGRGFDLLILDDLIKNAADADSPIIRESQVEFLRGTAMSRLEPGATLIVMMARWHEDDLIGWIHREMPGQFQRLRMPAIAEDPTPEFPSDPMGREPGEPLWPERFPLANLERRRERSGQYYFNALYQQRPSSPIGSVFHRDWWRRYEAPPLGFDQMIWSWDLSFKDTDDSSYVVGQVWGARGPDFYLLHQVRGQWDYPTTKRHLVAEVNHAEWDQARTTVFIEDKANGPAIIADLRHELGGLIPVQTGQDSKLARARSISGYVEARNVYLPDAEPWVAGFIEEHAAFPKGAHDDQVDATSQALRKLLERRGGEIVVYDTDLPQPVRR
jgi:predicted phage terminase large subunit-like protein